MIMATNAKPFVWYELTTTDTSAAQAFYGKVFGWDARDSGLPGMKYLLLSAASVELGGMLSLADAGCDTATPPFWLGYIGSDDVDKDTARVKAAGGKVHSEPADIPGIGRFAVVADPHGASFVLFRGAATDQMPAAAPAYTPGHIGWRELHAGNGEEAFAFYSEMFGWTKAEAMDMGPLGIYQIYAINGESAGGMMTKMADTPAPMWLYYVCVDDIDAAVTRAKDAGGKQLLETHEVPGGMWISQFLDPQGAMFAMVGPRR
jgi:predicted enzyme related to lactoylglutathione lyase